MSVYKLSGWGIESRCRQLKIARVIISMTQLKLKVFDNILIDEKLYKNILVYNISYKTLIGIKPLRIRFDKVNRFYRVYDGTIYLVLFCPEKYDATCNRIRYLISQKSGIAYVISHNYIKIKIYSYDSLLLEKTLTLHNVIILVKSVSNKNQNHYYYNIFLEKCWYQLPKNNDNK